MSEARNPLAKELRRLGNALRYSWAGFVAAFRTQASFRTDLLVVAILAPMALWLGQSALERALLLSTLILLLFAEILNSAVETVVDRMGLEYHQLSGRAKDLGSAAVFLACLNILAVWGFLLWDRFGL